MNVGILLAAGRSSRFSGIPKQLYVLNGKELVRHSADMMCDILDEVIIVTNSTCFNRTKKLFKDPKIRVIKNDIDCRIASIKSGLNHIVSATNIVIHDAARPFIENSHIELLLEQSESFLCSQFYFKLVNGLIKKDETGVDVVSREKYMELVTPQIIDYRLAVDLYQHHIGVDSCEIIPVLDKLKISYNLIEGHPRHLRKITTQDDLC